MSTPTSIIKIGLADDHTLLRHALATLINSFEGCQVIFEVNNGNEVIEALKEGSIPHLILLDLNMPNLDGHETAKWLRDNYPDVHVLMLTMYDSELALIRLLQAGVKGFLKKDVHPRELKFAIQSVIESGYYYSNNIAGKLANLFRNQQDDSILKRNLLSDTEIEFLKLTCADFTYKEIAQTMNMSPRAVDLLRDSLFAKLDVKSRIGLAMYAIKHGLVTF